MLWGKRSGTKATDAWTKVLAEGDAAHIESALIAQLPAVATERGANVTLETVMAWLQDAEQAKTLDYWQRARWGRGGESQALQELRRVFAKGPQWRSKTTRNTGLPPLYPE